MSSHQHMLTGSLAVRCSIDGWRLRGFSEGSQRTCITHKCHSTQKRCSYPVSQGTYYLVLNSAKHPRLYLWYECNPLIDGFEVEARSYTNNGDIPLTSADCVAASPWHSQHDEWNNGSQSKLKLIKCLKCRGDVFIRGALSPKPLFHRHVAFSVATLTTSSVSLMFDWRSAVFSRWLSPLPWQYGSFPEILLNGTGFYKKGICI